MDADRDLEEAVRKAMFYDKRLSSQPIDVSVKDAIVCLTGTVQSHSRAVAAYEIAASVPGVREVSKRLVVEPPGDLGDDDVANYVRTALDAHSEVMKAAITVSVSGGVVTLEGSVCDTWQAPSWRMSPAHREESAMCAIGWLLTCWSRSMTRR